MSERQLVSLSGSIALGVRIRRLALHVRERDTQGGESGQVHDMLGVPAAILSNAGVVKLADARDSKSRGGHPP